MTKSTPGYYVSVSSCRKPSEHTLLDVLLQVTQASLEELLLVSIDLADLVDLLNTVRAKLDLGGEEVDALVLEERALDESGLNDALLALGGAEKRLGEASTSHSHGKSGRASTVLGLDDLVTTELDAVHEVVTSLTLNAGVVGLGKEGDDSDTRVTTNDGDEFVGRVGVLDLGDEARGTDNVQGGDTEDALGVVDALGLEDLGDDGDGGVHLPQLVTGAHVDCVEDEQGWR